ncbi:MAG TPA: hypothetical protein ENN66_05915 [Proteobacteria bacterium]|mgnify:CR=1 FL=1|nr:hypothetical protein [Pseudomonadota bacterium]
MTSTLFSPTFAQTPAALKISIRTSAVGRLLLGLGLLLWILGPPAVVTAANPSLGKTTNFYGDVRYRLEYQDNFNARYYGSDPPSGSDSFLLQRIRLGLRHSFSEKLELGLGIQDARAFGVDLEDDKFYSKNLGLTNHPYKDYAEPYETYVKIKNIGGQNLSLKAGRQSIRYGDNRIFGPGDWGNTGRYHWDAVRLAYRRQAHFLEALWGAHIIHEPRTLSLRHRHNLYGGALYGHYEIRPELIVEPFFIRKYDRHDHYQGESGGGDRDSWF